MVARHSMARGVASPSHFPEKLSDLARENALVLQAAQQVVLGLLRGLIQADLRCYELSEKLGELPQLEERGIRVVGKVPLREHAQTQELLVVLLQVSKVAREQWRLTHLLDLMR